MVARAGNLARVILSPSDPRMRLSLARLRIPCLLLAAVGFSETGHAQARWTLTETLRIGGAETGPASFLATWSIEADSRGRILVYDRRTQDIRMFGPDGKLVRVIGRVGSGPGELRDAEGIAIARDGKLWVRDAANARFSLFSSEGDFEKSWTMKFCSSQGAWNPQMDRTGRIVDEDCVVGGGRARKDVVLAYHTDMSRVDTLADIPACGTTELAEAGWWITRTARGGSYRAIPYAASTRTALGPEGEVWCVPNSSRFEIRRLKAGAKDTTRISRSASPVPVTAFERDSVIAELESKGPTGLDFSRIPKAKPAIERLTVDDRGRLWVRHTNAKGAIAFDIYSSNGRIIATAELGVHNSSIWQPFVVRGDNVYTVVLDEDDVQYVARFRITR